MNICPTPDFSVCCDGQLESVPVDDLLERVCLGEGPAGDEEDGLLAPRLPRLAAVLHLAVLLHPDVPAAVGVLLAVKHNR